MKNLKAQEFIDIDLFEDEVKAVFLELDNEEDCRKIISVVFNKYCDDLNNAKNNSKKIATMMNILCKKNLKVLEKSPDNYFDEIKQTLIELAKKQYELVEMAESITKSKKASSTGLDKESPQV